MSADLCTTLLACQNPDPTIRNQAEQFLVQAEQSNFPAFLQALATELATDGKDENARQLAGLHLKNMLMAKDTTELETRVGRWKTLSSADRGPIKAALLQALRSSSATARHTAAQASAEVAAIELPYNEWPELLPSLTATSNDGETVCALECLGFTCERLATTAELDTPIDQSITDKMLTTIVGGLNNANQSVEVVRAACVALRHSVLFSAGNFENVNERNVVMSAICGATQSQDPRVRASAYECIAEITFHYYDKMRDYMPSLFNVTMECIRKDQEEVALQALEFWSTIAEEEIELLYLAEEEGEGAHCERYIAGALEHLAPLLTEIMTKQDEEADDDAWNLSMAGGTCLSLVAATVQDAVVPAVMPFVNANINHEHWRMREAATMAFSTILDGPSEQAIGPYVNQSIPVLLRALQDPHPMVKDSSAWTLGKICDLHVLSIPTETFPSLVNSLSAILMTETPKVSAQACFALHNLAAAFASDDSSERIGTNALSQFLPTILQTLLSTADRSDGDEANLRISAFEAITVMIQNSAPDCKPILLQLLPAVVERLRNSILQPVLTNDEKEMKENLQGLLCGVTQVICMKVTKDEVAPFCDNIMTCLLQILDVKNSVSHEEAFLAVGAIADILAEDFEKYLQAFQRYLMDGLRNFESYQVCRIAVGVVGDLCRAVEGKIQPYCDDIMSALLQSLQNASLHRNVKPPVLSSFGDIALAIEGGYEPYLQVSLMMLLQASQTQAPSNDEDLYLYVMSLRDSILEAYTGILQGLKQAGRADLLLPYIENIMGFLELIANDAEVDESVMSKAIGCVGDVASAMGPRVRELVAKPWVQALFQNGQSMNDETIMKTCQWSSEQVRAILTTPVVG